MSFSAWGRGFAAALAVSTATVAAVPAIAQDVMDATGEIYKRLVAPHVHQRW